MPIKNPPFQITDTMIDLVAEIAELMGRLTVTNQLSVSPVLRRNNRIRTIHGSLAIEQNTLSIEQVTDVLNGKQVLAPPKDIAEVKNAYEIYEKLDQLDPYSADDLLMAHGIMTKGLVEESGMFRSQPVGVVDQEGHQQIVHRVRIKLIQLFIDLICVFNFGNILGRSQHLFAVQHGGDLLNAQGILLNRQGTVNRPDSVIPAEHRAHGKLIGNRKPAHQLCNFCHQIDHGMRDLKRRIFDWHIVTPC